MLIFLLLGMTWLLLFFLTGNKAPWGMFDREKAEGEKAPGSRNNKSELQRPSVNSNGLNTLPNTGESQTGMATLAGLVGLAVAARLRQRKEK